MLPSQFPVAICSIPCVLLLQKFLRIRFHGYRHPLTLTGRLLSGKCRARNTIGSRRRILQMAISVLTASRVSPRSYFWICVLETPRAVPRPLWLIPAATRKAWSFWPSSCSTRLSQLAATIVNPPRIRVASDAFAFAFAAACKGQPFSILISAAPLRIFLAPLAYALDLLGLLLAIADFWHATASSSRHFSPCEGRFFRRYFCSCLPARYTIAAEFLFFSIPLVLTAIPFLSKSLVKIRMNPTIYNRDACNNARRWPPGLVHVLRVASLWRLVIHSRNGSWASSCCNAAFICATLVANSMNSSRFIG